MWSQRLDAQPFRTVPLPSRRLPTRDRRPPTGTRAQGSERRKPLTSREVSREEAAQRQPVEPLEGTEAGAVVPAREHRELVFDSATPELVDEHFREVDGERQIVTRVHEEQALVAHAVEVRVRRDWHPDAPEALQVDVTVEPLPDMVGGEARPHDVGKVRRDVIEGSCPQPRLVRGRQHRQARAQARAENADRLVALRGEPLDAAPGVEHCLPAHLRGPADVRADDVVGAPQFGRHAVVVIREAEPKRADLEAVQEPAEADVSARVGVPLRQHDDGPLAPGRRVVGQVPRAHQVVFGVRRFHRARVRQPLAVEPEVGARREREELIARGDHLVRPAFEMRAGRGHAAGAVHLPGDPIEAPLERPHDAVGRDRRQAPLPRVKDAAQHSGGLILPIIL